MPSSARTGSAAWQDSKPNKQPAVNAVRAFLAAASVRIDLTPANCEIGRRETIAGQGGLTSVRLWTRRAGSLTERCETVNLGRRSRQVEQVNRSVVEGSG